MSTERPILFSAPMVRALLAGRKTQTRRLVQVPEIVASEPDDLEPGERWGYTSIEQRDDGVWRAWITEYPDEGSVTVRCPYGQAGDRLWVREAWRAWEQASDGLDHIQFAADDARVPIPNSKAAGDFVVGRFDRWYPSIHMPRWASRLTLEVTEVRAERLQGISERDASAEGLTVLTKDGGRVFKWGIPDRDGLPGTDDDGWPWQDWEADPRKAYARAWDAINGKRAPWAEDPWVWVVSFAVMKTQQLSKASAGAAGTTTVEGRR